LEQLAEKVKEESKKMKQYAETETELKELKKGAEDEGKEEIKQPGEEGVKMVKVKVKAKVNGKETK